MQKYQDVVLNQNGNPIAGAEITVTDLLGAPVPVYASNGIGLNVNPVSSNADGRFFFYAPDGRYNLVVRFGGNIMATVTDILLEDPQDGSDAVFNDVTVLGALSDARKIASTPTGTLSATDVQSALAELETEKASIADLASPAAGKGAEMVAYQPAGVGAVATTVEARLQAYEAPGGAGLLGYQPSGTGAVATNVQSKLREFVSVRDFGAVGDGVADDTESFRRAFATGKAVYAPSGRYLLNFLNVPSNTMLFGDGANTVISPLLPTIRCALGADSGDNVSFIDDIVIKDVTFLGSVDTTGFSEQTHLTSFNGVRNMLIENCRFIGFRGDGLFIGTGNHGDPVLRSNHSVTVRKCFFDGVNKDNRMGVTVISGNGVLIEDCYFTRCARPNMPGAIDIEPELTANYIVKNIIVRGCKFFDNGGGVAAIAFHLPFGNYTIAPNSFIVENNYIENNASAGIYFGHPIAGGVTETTRDLGVIIRNNYVLDAARPFSIQGAKNVLIEGNTFNTTNDSGLLGFTSADTRTIDVTISNNKFLHCAGAGVSGLTVFNTNRLTISNNEFNDCGTVAGSTGIGIQFHSGEGSNITITGNNFVSPQGRMATAIRVEPEYTAQPATNSFYGNRLSGLSNNFPWLANGSALAMYTADSQPFLPVISGAATAGVGTYVSQQGTFSRIGNLVFFSVFVRWSAHTGTGQLVCSIPTAVSPSSLEFTEVHLTTALIALPAGARSVGFVVRDSHRVAASTVNGGELQVFNLPAVGEVYISGHYTTT